MILVFISYSHQDKEFVDRLAAALLERKVHFWMDRWEMKVGDSIVEKIQDAISSADVLCVVLSPQSLESPWCKKELTIGLVRELEERRVVVLPVLLEDCDMPVFLTDKLYADFRANFEDGLVTLSEAIEAAANESLGRVEGGDYLTDYALDWDVVEEKVFLRIDSISFSRDWDYSVFARIVIRGNEAATSRYLEFVQADLARVGRDVILRVFSDVGEEHDLRVTIDDNRPVETTIRLEDQGTDRAYAAEVFCRRLGQDNGKSIVFDVGTTLRETQSAILSTAAPLTPEEQERLQVLLR